MVATKNGLSKIKLQAIIHLITIRPTIYLYNPEAKFHSHQILELPFSHCNAGTAHDRKSWQCSWTTDSSAPGKHPDEVRLAAYVSNPAFNEAKLLVACINDE